MKWSTFCYTMLAPATSLEKSNISCSLTFWRNLEFQKSAWTISAGGCLWAWSVWQILIFLPLHNLLYLDCNFKIRRVKKNILVWMNNWWKDSKRRCEGKSSVEFFSNLYADIFFFSATIWKGRGAMRCDSLPIHKSIQSSKDEGRH